MNQSNYFKHLLLKKCIICLGKTIEIKILKNIFSIIIDQSKFTTVADIFLDRIIRLVIFILYPFQGVLSEESKQTKNITWIIDPLDGTRSYVNRFKGYVIQACRVESSKIVESIIYAPALDKCFSFLEGDLPRENNKIIKIKPIYNQSKIKVIDNYSSPKGITKYLCENIKNSSYIESGSLSMKSLYVCLGYADIFVKDVLVRDWDVAPIIPFLKLRDCMMKDINGSEFKINPFSYEKKGLVVCSLSLSEELFSLINSYHGDIVS